MTASPPGLPAHIAALETELRAGVAEIGLALDGRQITALLTWLALLQKWNAVYNLTAVRQPRDMLRYHLLDSLAAVPALQRQLAQIQATTETPDPQHLRLLDVGSGGGLPGIVFAICCPDLRVDCIDTAAKKTAFIRQCAAQLRLPNLGAIHARVESLANADYHVICSRAFAALPDFVSWSRHALAPHGVWMAMKGKTPLEEIARLPENVAVFHVEQLHVPHLDAERCLIWIAPGG